MGLPPKGDPRRTVQIAIYWLWTMGTLTFLPGVLLLWHIYSSSFSSELFVLEISFITFGLFAPGVMYMLSAIYLKRNVRWAIRLGMWPALLNVAAAFCILLIGIISLPELDPYGSAIILGSGAVLLVVFIWLAVVLSHAGFALRSLSQEARRGFEAVMPRSVEEKQSDGDL